MLSGDDFDTALQQLLDGEQGPGPSEPGTDADR